VIGQARGGVLSVYEGMKVHQKMVGRGAKESGRVEPRCQASDRVYVPCMALIFWGMETQEVMEYRHHTGFMLLTPEKGLISAHGWRIINRLSYLTETLMPLAHMFTTRFRPVVSAGAFLFPILEKGR
jgi:hypothetical protein